MVTVAFPSMFASNCFFDGILMVDDQQHGVTTQTDLMESFNCIKYLIIRGFNGIES